MACDSPAVAEGAFHRRLVEAAILAPTPDNNQPWRFVSRGNRLDVFLDPARSLPSDVHSMFDLLGLGAAVENIRIAAGQCGYESQVECAGTLGDAAVAAGVRAAVALRFQPGGRLEPLFGQLATRRTCRAGYSREPVDKSLLSHLAESAAEFPRIQLDWVVDRSPISRLAGVIAASDRIRLEHEPFHAELFRQLRFSVGEVEATRDGLDVRTLALPPGAAMGLRALGRWSRMRLVHRLGLGGLLAVPSWLSVRRSGAVGLVSVDEPEARSFVEGGRAFQRIWLTAEAAGLALQPLGSLPIFLAHLRQLGGTKLAGRHVERIERLGGEIDRLAPAVAGRTLVMLFRLGRGPTPRFRSLRRAVEDVFEVQS